MYGNSKRTRSSAKKKKKKGCQIKMHAGGFENKTNAERVQCGFSFFYDDGTKSD